MAFVLETIIGEIHDNYATLPGGRERPEALLGNLERAKNADCPRIVWTLQGGNFGSARLAASAPAVDAKAPPEGASPHYQAEARFWVWIWQVDLETCWNVMVDLLAAIRLTVYGPNMGPQNFQCPTEIEGRHQDRGEVIVLDVVLSVPIPRDGTVPGEEVVITTLTTDVKERDLIDGVNPDIELVIVTNP